MERKSSPDAALASDVFDQFCSASTLKTVLTLHRHLCELLRLRPAPFPHFYPQLKGKLRSWRAQALWAKFDKRVAHKCYARGTASEGTRVLIIGAGPCGLRAAIEAQLLGAKVVVLEKRDRISRNNVLHLWPFVIHDLRSLGAKKFFGKFCAGAIDHISIRQLQVILLKVALLLGVELHVGVSFESLVPPVDSSFGWRAETSPEDHPASQFEFNCLIGADGKRNTLEGFGRKEFRGKLAIAITANFINKRSEAEARVEEISGVAFIFNQKFFRDLYEATGIDLENIVYYKDDTHYFVMTAKKNSLIDKGVIISDQPDTARLLHPDNVDKEALMEYAREAADFSTQYQLPHLEFAVNHYGKPDVAMFDFTSMYAAENASRVVERHGHRLLMQLVGDSLLEPFWPTGSGCARGFLSSLDACWAVRSWGSGVATPLEVVAERESIYRLLGQTTPENLNKDFNAYTLEPQTRYPNLNIRAVLPAQVRNLLTTDNPAGVELCSSVQPVKKRRREVEVASAVLVSWLKRQMAVYDDVQVGDDLAACFSDGRTLCTLVHRYRPQLVDLAALRADESVLNLQLAFNVLEKEAQIKPIIKAEEWASGENSDAIITYLGQVYDAFRGEIPHIKHAKSAIEEIEEILVAPRKSIGKSPKKRASLEREPKRQMRKRKSHDAEPSTSRREELDRNREDRMQRRRMMRHLTSQKFVENMRRMQSVGNFYDEPREEKTEDFSLTVYRQHAPHFKDRVKQLERQMIYCPDRENRFMSEIAKRSGQPDEKFSGRIKELEAKFKDGNAVCEKKPKDLRRAIGRIDKNDWNIAEIEKKMEENRMAKGKTHGGEKVPKWNHDKFLDKISMMQSKLKGRSKEDEAAKFREIDSTLKKLDRQIREGSVLDPSGPRGSNKVSAMAEQLAKKQEPSEALPLQKSGSKSAFAVAQQASDCHFCCKKVYLMEQLTAEGLLFHRGCFRCEYCGTTLRLNNYAFDRDGRYGSRFVCINHFGIPGYIRGARARRKSEDLKAAAAEETAFTEHLAVPSAEDQADAIPTIGVTPERVGFENLAGSDEEDLMARPASGLAEMDEEAWTDHNFRVSCDSSDDQSDSATDSDDEDAEAFEEAIDDDDALSVEGTRQLAESWKQRYSRQSASEFSDEAESSEWSCERDDAEDEDDSSTATEGDAVARELLRQKERLLERAKRRREEDSEGGSDCTSTETETDDEDEQEEENLATEIETDSEFELDSSLPTILIDSDLQVCQVRSGRIERGNLNKPAPNKYLQKNNAKNNNRAAAAAPMELTQAALRHRPTQLELQAKEKMVPLQQVKSTEGIASKTSLELKKKYLLGGEAAAGAFGRQVLKSDSASALDSRFRSFVSQISEQQKLLQPAAQPSPAMQSLLLDSNKATSASPLLTSMSSGNLLNNRADLLNKLPKVPSSFVHICGRKSEERLDDDKTPLVENMHILASSEAEEKERKLDRDTDRESDKISDLEREKPDEDATPQAEHRDIILETKDISDEPRPRSPAHETSIIVPDASEWRAAQQQQLQQGESESESSESSSSSSSESGSSTETEEVEEAPLVVPPRVEITEVGDKELETELSDWAHEENSLDVDVEIEARNVTLRRPKRLATLAQEDNDDDLGDHVDVLTVSETNEEKQQLVLAPVDDIVEAVNLECQIAPLASAPDPEPSVESEKVEEEEQPPPPPPPLQVEEENGPVDVMSVSVSSLGEGINDIEFVDTSEDEEDGEESSVKVEEYQPLAQASSSTNTESKTPDTESKSPDTEQERLLQEDEYVAHVHRLQDRVSPFGNAKDSIDVRKARRGSSNSSTSSPSHRSSAAEIQVAAAVATTPSTSRKLEQISRERSRQKSLVEDLVMARIPQKGVRRRLSSKSPSGSPRLPPPPVPPPPVPPPPVPMPPSGRPASVLLTGVRLPETPLTHPEAFSCPDIRQALLAEAAASTPVAPPRAKKKPQAQTEPIKGGAKQGRERRKSIMQAVSELFRKSPAADKEKKGPPVPPPPAHYPPASPPAQEDSPSDGEDSRSFSVEDSVRRSARSAKKAARQAQLKRLRTAHELKRQLEELEVKQRQLEQRGVALEKALKGEAAAPHANEADMLHEWFALMRQLAEARRHERQLTIKAQELELHERHARLQSDLRQRMAVDDVSSVGCDELIRAQEQQGRGGGGQDPERDSRDR
ncbi:F-actin-monooxygenase Mical isoform X2 [Cloeon dipterum]|uniref:F-actin-monooxygenase Mical isoform X2 n=1 Tax=Cloeon dipterum TaxID=197152 RepID=UPI00321FCCB6